MNKYIISAVVIIGFVIYSYYERVFGTPITPVVIKQNTISQVQPTTIPTPSIIPTATVYPTTVSGAPTHIPLPTIQNTPTPTPTPGTGLKNGTFTGSPADAFYGMIQVQATISNGKITNIQFLQAPNDRGTSIAINEQADPMLAQEAIQAQSATVNIVSGATDSSMAFIQSLQSAISQAKS
jgi:uncharacterized protein with FMN-binding domain